MTERKQLREQVTSLTYTGAREVSRVNGGTVAPSPRRVTIPDANEETAYSAYAQRRVQRQRQVRVQEESYIQMPARASRQTGERASHGSTRAARFAQQQYTGTTPIPPRHRMARRGNFIMKLLGLFAILVVGILVANFALTSSTFRVEQVSIVGTHNHLLVSAIRHMGMQGQNIFLLNVAIVTARLEAMPLVASANIAKQWPNGVAVTVEERAPVLLWQTKHATYSVDNQGVVIALASDTTGADQLHTVVDLRSQQGLPTIVPGPRLQAAVVAFAQAIFERLPKVTGVASFTLRYETMPGTQGSQFTIGSSDGWVAYVGNASDVNPLDNRLIELSQILTLAQQQNLSLATIDLRFGLTPVYTVKN